MSLKKPNCFIDFDGTIVCNKKRIYQFFTDNIDDKYKKCLDIDEFWNLKKLGINEIDWINEKYNDNLDKNKWTRLKKENIEKEEYLKHNSLFSYSINALTQLKNQYNLILVTRRSNEQNLMQELENLNLICLFEDILVMSHGNRSKASVIRQFYRTNYKDILIGDTEDDISSAVDLNIKPIFVKSGIRSEWILRRYFKHVSNIICIQSINDIDFIKLNRRKG